MFTWSSYRVWAPYPWGHQRGVVDGELNRDPIAARRRGDHAGERAPDLNGQLVVAFQIDGDGGSAVGPG